MANNLLGGRPRQFSDEELMSLYGNQAAETIVRNEQNAPRQDTGILGMSQLEDFMAESSKPRNTETMPSTPSISSTPSTDTTSQSRLTPSAPPEFLAKGTQPSGEQYNLDVRGTLDETVDSNRQDEIERLRAQIAQNAAEKAIQDPNLSDAQRQRIIDSYEERRGKFNLPALFGGIGATLQGGSGAEGASRILDKERQDFQDELGAFDTQREQSYQNEMRERERRTYENNRDPNSAKSKLARRLMESMNEDVPEDFTYQQMVEFNPVLGQLFDRQMQQAKFQQEAARQNREFSKENRKLNQETEAKSGPGGEYVTAEEAAAARKNSRTIAGTSAKLEEAKEMIEQGASRNEIESKFSTIKADIRSLMDEGVIGNYTEEELDSLLYADFFTTDNRQVQRLTELQNDLAGARQATIGTGTRSSAQQNLTTPTSEFDTRNPNRIVRMIGPNGATYVIPPQLVGEAQARGLRPQ